MKLHNNTTIDDDLVRRLITKAGRAAGARTNGVVVFVNQGSGYRSSGVAHRCDMVRIYNGKRSRRASRGRWNRTDGGYFVIRMPRTAIDGTGNPFPDPVDQATNFFRVAVHEFAHIRDYQSIRAGERLDWSRKINGRRPAHSVRPEEERAFATVAECCDHGDAETRACHEIVDLAIALEEKARA